MVILFLKNFSLFLVFAAKPSKTSAYTKKNFLHSHVANFRHKLHTEVIHL